MFLMIAFLCFALVMLACMLAPTSAPKVAAPEPAMDETPVEGRQPVLA